MYLKEGFKRPVYWNQYKTEMKPRDLNNHNPLRNLLEALFQGVKRLFVLAFDNTDNSDKKVERDSHKKYFLARVNISNYNVLVDGRNFYDQPIGDKIKKYKEDRKSVIGHRDDYTTNTRSINESSNSIGKKYISFIRNSSSISNRCRSSKENMWFWNNNTNNFKQING